MAKKLNTEERSKKIERKKFYLYIAKIKSERPRFIAGIISFFFGIFLLIAEISFLFTGAADQSKVLNRSFWSLLFDKELVIKNWTGVAGAFFSEQLINQGFGIFAVVLSIFLVYIGLHLMRLRNVKWFKAFFIMFFCLIWGSVTSSLLLSSLDSYSHIIWGGAHGMVVEELLERLLGVLGLLLLIVLSLFVFLIIVKREFINKLRDLILKPRKESEIKAVDIANDTTEEALVDQNNDNKGFFSFLKKKTSEIIADVNVEDDDVDISTPSQEQEGLHNSDDAVVTPASPPVKLVVNSNGFEVVMAEEEEVVTDTASEYEKPIVNNELRTPPTAEEVLESEEYDPRADLTHFAFPSSTLLKVYENGNKQVDMEEQTDNKNKIINTLLNYGIEITNIKATVGPTITLYEIIPKAGVRISKIRNLEDDIALSLSALGIRIIAPMPGKGTIGIEVPNKDPQIVSMQSVIASKKFQDFKGQLPVAIGKTITNETFVFDLAKLPHLLVAGATGQGKSVGLNAIITSLLYKKHPAEMKMVLVDPKMVEFSIYSTIEKHYLAKLPGEEKAIITDVTKVTQTLTSLTIMMDERYELLMKAGVRNIIEYNEMFVKRRLSPRNGHKFLPYIVIVIDEFGDLIMTAGKEIEMPIARIAQKARAVGMHLIIATQRPTTNIITGTIKANFPARMAFRVMSQIDSRTILDSTGANQLIGRGDLLFSSGSELVRIQCAFVDTPEVQEITSYIGEQQGYANAHELPEFVPDSSDATGAMDMGDKDPLFEEAARLIVTHQSGSTSLIQRKFSIGYNRAGRLMDQLEVAGIVGPTQGSKPREVYIMDEYNLEQKLADLGN